MPISPPVQITVPFATSGLKNAIPANTNNVTGNAGYDAGFGAINMTPKTAGGIPPFGQDFNGIFFDVTTAIQFFEAGGSFVFSSAFAAAVGGYPIGALVLRSDGTGLWRNVVANNTNDPEGVGTGWQPEDAGAASIAMTNANVTLTRLQASRPIILLSGVLTANLQLIFPNYVKQWLVVNTCTGAFSVTAKTAAGSGIAIPAGVTQPIYGDSINIGAYGTSSGRLIGVQVFTSAATYTPTAGTASVIVEVVGGGGGGGGANAAGAGQISAGGHGGSGAYGKGRFTSGFSGGSVTIGAAGAAGGIGGAGGTTNFAGLISASGGAGGGAGIGFTPPGSSGGATQGGISIVGGNIETSAGFIAQATVAVSTTAIINVQGAPSHFGPGPSGGFGNGTAATTPGSGGTGALAGPSSGPFNGGAGAAGKVIVWEYSA